MKKPRLRVSTTRRVRYPVHGNAPTKSSDDSKPSGMKRLSNKERKDRYQR